MIKKSAQILIACLTLAACASSQPRIIQASSGSTDIVLTVGLATQIELPEDARVSTITVGNPALISAEQASDVVNLVSKSGEAGETNLIIRAREDGSKVKVYQYHITVQKP